MPDEFPGHIGRTYDESEPWWPEQTRAPEDAPNVLLIALDDVYRDRQPFAFTGDIARVTVDVSGEPFVDHEAELDRIMERE